MHKYFEPQRFLLLPMPTPYFLYNRKILSYKIHISSDSYANTQSQVKSDISTEGFCSSTLICNSWVSELAKIPQLCITSKITSQALDILTLLLLCSLGEQSVFYVWPINVRNAFFLPYFTMALVLHVWPLLTPPGLSTFCSYFKSVLHSCF